MNLECVYYTKSMIDDDPEGPIHIHKGEYITLCGKYIDWPRWDYTNASPTCKKCLQIRKEEI